MWLLKNYLKSLLLFLQKRLLKCWVFTQAFSQLIILTLLEEILVQKFTSLPPQDQLSFVQGIQRLKYLFSAINFPLKVGLFQTPIQLILYIYS